MAPDKIVPRCQVLIGRGGPVPWPPRSPDPGTPCIYSLMIFVVKNREMFYTNKFHYEINTRHIMDIHMTQVNLAIYGKGVYHMTVRICNALANTLKEISKDIKSLNTI
jgi:hypothetical protein